MAKKRKKIKTKDIITAIVTVIIVIVVVIYAYQNKEVFTGKDSQSVSSVSDKVIDAGELENFTDMEIHFIDVGQGDCILIRFPDGKNMLIDAGKDNVDVESAIEEYFNKYHISKLDYMLATHQDEDHIGSMDFVLENYEVDYAFRPNVHSSNDAVSSLSDVYNSPSNGGKESSSKTYATFLNDLVAEKCEVEIFNTDSDFTGRFSYEGDEYEYCFDFLTPVAAKSEISYSDANDYSPICCLSYGEFSIIFTGDAGTDIENEYLENYADKLIDCDVLKIGHHGSTTSSSTAFLSSIKPEYAVIQVGTGNSYKHPKQATLDKLSLIESTVYRNDTNGDIVLKVKSDGSYSFELEKTDCSLNGVGF